MLNLKIYQSNFNLIFRPDTYHTTELTADIVPVATNVNETWVSRVYSVAEQPDQKSKPNKNFDDNEHALLLREVTSLDEIK